MIGHFACLFFLFTSAVAYGQKFTNTFAQPPKAKASDGRSIRPASEITGDHEKYTWVVKAEIDGQKVGNQVPVYNMGPGEIKAVVGYVNEGTEIKLDKFQTSNYNNYYVVPEDKITFMNKTKSVQKKTSFRMQKQFWVNGIYVYAK